MNELYHYLYELEDELDNLDIIKNVDNLLIDIKNNKELLEKLNKYHAIPSEKLKKEIYNYSEFIKFKECENNINLLILQINNRLNILKEKKGCCR